MAEERFQNLTVAQWIFHYKEIQKYKGEEVEREVKMFKGIIDHLNILGFLTNPKLGKSLLEGKGDGKMEEIDPATFHDTWEKIKKTLPDPSKIAVKDDVNRFIHGLPTFKRDELAKVTGFEVESGMVEDIRYNG